MTITIESLVIVILFFTNIVSYFHHEFAKTIVSTLEINGKNAFFKIWRTIFNFTDWLSVQEYDFSLNSREKAIIILFCLFIIWSMTKKGIRKASLNVVKTLLNKHFVRVYIEIMLYEVIVCYLLYKIGFWSFLYTKDTILWVLFSALYLSYRSVNKKNDDKVFIKIIKDSLTITVFFEFLQNIYTFPIVVELILIAILIIIGLLIGSPESQVNNKNDKILNKYLNGITIFIIVNIWIFVIIEIVKNYENILTLETLKSFFLPIIYTLTLIPYLYYLILYVAYDEINLRLKLNKKSTFWMKLYFRITLVLKTGISRTKVLKISNHKKRDIFLMKNRDDIKKIFDPEGIIINE